VKPDPNAPKLVITGPAEGATVTGGSVPITYTTTGSLAGVDHVHFQVDNEPVKMDLSFDGNFVFAGVHVGSHTLNGWLVRADHSKIAGTDAASDGSKTAPNRLVCRACAMSLRWRSVVGPMPRRGAASARTNAGSSSSFAIRRR